MARPGNFRRVRDAPSGAQSPARGNPSLARDKCVTFVKSKAEEKCMLSYIRICDRVVPVFYDAGWFEPSAAANGPVQVRTVKDLDASEEIVLESVFL